MFAAAWFKKKKNYEFTKVVRTALTYYMLVY